MIGVIFCFGVACLSFFKSISQYRQQYRLANTSDGTEIQCPIVTTLGDRVVILCVKSNVMCKKKKYV